MRIHQALFVLLIAAIISLTGCMSGNGGQWSSTDNTAPTVSSTMTAPADDGSGAATNGAITATFSEGMSPFTITDQTFFLKQGIVDIPCTVTYTGTSATLRPVAVLAANTIYTATITTGVKDLAGYQLAADHSFSFTTGTMGDSIPPTMSSTITALYAPSDFGAGVALNGSITASFSEAMDPASINDSTFLLKKGTTVIGCDVTYVGTVATLNPSDNLEANTTYTVAITTGAKDLAGNYFTTGQSWSFTTGTSEDNTVPTVSSTFPATGAVGSAVNGNITATFSEGISPGTVTSNSFTLMQGTTLIPCDVTYVGTIATLNPTSNLAANTLYTALLKKAVTDLAGNALVLDSTWSFTTGAALDTTAPVVSSTIPASAATGVAVNSNITGTFSEAMAPATVTTATFTLRQGGAPVTCEVTYVGMIGTLHPTDNLKAGTVYSAEISTTAKDLAGNALAVKKTWSFTTGTTADATAPLASSTVPANAATGVAINANISVTFSEAMNPATITSVSFTLKQGATAIESSVATVGSIATLNPINDLAASTQYTATITTAVRDLAGNALAVAKTWSFTTGAASDTTAPAVSSTLPASAATAVAVNANVTATFSEAMDPSTITAAIFTLLQGTVAVLCDATYVGTIATLNPVADLTAGTIYTATITTGAKDLAGNALAVAKTWSFTTGATSDTTAPTVSSTHPASAATAVSVN
ncbi:MAG: Ig-like domain-containing protein, partial [Candidatus Wallbacteria bacterium]|nr:Ig-like domain-containing protein [Candidatus Wallbacteria bacterium]